MFKTIFKNNKSMRLFKIKLLAAVSSRNQKRAPVVPARSVLDVGRERWKNVGGVAPDVMSVPGHVRGQGRRHQDVDTRTGPGAVPCLFGSEGPGSGGEPVLREIPGQDPEAAQV